MDLGNRSSNGVQITTGEVGAAKALAVATLADVVGVVRGRSELSEQRRKELEAGVRAFGRLLNRPIESIPALPQSLGHLFASLSSTTTGKSGKTLANTVSLVKAAVAAAGVGRRVRFNGKPLSPEWARLYGKPYPEAISTWPLTLRSLR